MNLGDPQTLVEVIMMMANADPSHRMKLRGSNSSARTRSGRGVTEGGRSIPSGKAEDAQGRIETDQDLNTSIMA
jgi:hypothetical protein